MRILTNSYSPGPQFDILCFSGIFHDATYFENQKSIHFNEILKRIPTGWEPDVVLFRSPFYRPIPVGIEDSPFPTVAIVDDWFGGIDYLPDNLRRFDYIVTDKYTVQVLNKLGFDNVDYWPVFGFPIGKFYRNENVSRPIDLLFAGNHNINIQYERLSWLGRLCRIDSKYTVKIFHNLFNEPYREALQQSKIVFNRSIKGEMNMRAYEACACGSLLFIEEENLEIRDFLKPGIDCILYNNNNLEELIKGCLEDSLLRETIALHGYYTIQQFTEEKLFSRLIDQIALKKLTPGCGRKKNTTYAVNIDHRNLIQEGLSIHGLDLSFINKSIGLVEKYPSEHRIMNDCAVFLASFAEGNPNKETSGIKLSRELIQSAIQLLSNVINRKPEYIVAQFNLAQIYQSINLNKKAYEQFQKILSNTKSIGYDMLKGIVLPIHYLSPLRYQWSNSIEKDIEHAELWAGARLKVLWAMSAIKMGHYELEQGMVNKALVSFQAADNYTNNQPLVYDYLPFIFKELKEWSLAKKSCRNGLLINPFNIALWKLTIQLFEQEDKFKEAVLFLQDCIICLNRVQFATDAIKAEFTQLLNHYDNCLNKSDSLHILQT